MKERPFPMSAEEVRAILDGRKTQTRRVIKDQPEKHQHGWRWTPKAPGDPIIHTPAHFKESPQMPKYCPHGQPGDRLWVREKWADLRQGGFDTIVAWAAETLPGSEGDEQRIAYGIKWKPSIHMPRKLSRIILEITDVRVERVQDISIIDSHAEGVETISPADMEKHHYCTPFEELWNSINEKLGFGWDKNPWVWVIEFKRVEQREKAGKK